MYIDRQERQPENPEDSSLYLCV